MKLAVLIDDDGRALSPDAAPLSSLLACDPSAEGVIDQTVRRLGFVAAYRSGRFTRIVFNRKKANDRTLATLVAWSEDVGLGEIILNDLARTRGLRIIAGAQGLRRVVDGLFADKHRDICERFLTRKLPASEVARFVPFAKLRDLWAERAATSVGSLAKLYKGIFADRFTILAEHGPELRIGAMGNGYITYSPTYVETAIGTTLEDDPDKAYGRWVSCCYDTIDSRDTFLCDEVDAIVHSVRMGGIRHLRYRRLVLPFTSQSGKRLLASGAVLNSAIDLRREH